VYCRGSRFACTFEGIDVVGGTVQALDAANHVCLLPSRGTEADGQERSQKKSGLLGNLQSPHVGLVGAGLQLAAASSSGDVYI